ncbi:MAG TPA: leucyl/phenylalanyl-tRNA--protein transferase [Flavitalea sp.]|nr:leucyl/phenylalanyl-tRNA--protein transferase [Flavitalea sp.]
MPIFALDNTLVFPPVHLSEPDGLLAVGGDLSRERLLLAYRQGIFPWYEGDDILWWCPDPRFVLFPDELKVSKTMKSLIRKGDFTFTINAAFEQVINSCKTVSRRGQDSTWISDDVKRAYAGLHSDGYAHSAEAWFDGKLVGGLYGIRMGNVFFGESMFSTMSNASKFAFISYVDVLQSQGVVLIDCQVYTQHLESLGARMIERKEFVELLKENL